MTASIPLHIRWVFPDQPTPRHPAQAYSTPTRGIAIQGFRVYRRPDHGVVYQTHADASRPLTADDRFFLQERPGAQHDPPSRETHPDGFAPTGSLTSAKKECPVYVPVSFAVTVYSSKRSSTCRATRTREMRAFMASFSSARCASSSVMRMCSINRHLARSTIFSSSYFFCRRSLSVL